MKKILLITFWMLGSMAQAQDILLWKVENTLSPTIIPIYDGQPSPFPKAQNNAPEPVNNMTVEAEAERKKRLAALAKAQQILNSNDAFKPDLTLLRFNGVIEGIQGARALLDNQWVKVGRTLQVRTSITPEVFDAIEVLRQYDVDAANQMEQKLDQRYNANPQITLKISKITLKEVVLDGDHGTYRIPIQSNYLDAM